MENETQENGRNYHEAKESTILPMLRSHAHFRDTLEGKPLTIVYQTKIRVEVTFYHGDFGCSPHFRASQGRLSNLQDLSLLSH